MKKEKETRTEEFIGGWSNAPSPAIFTVGQTAINCRVPISNTGCQLINICKKYNALQQLQKLNMILKTDFVVAETLKSSPNTSEITSFTSLALVSCFKKAEGTFRHPNSYSNPSLGLKAKWCFTNQVLEWRSIVACNQCSFSVLIFYLKRKNI